MAATRSGMRSTWTGRCGIFDEIMSIAVLLASNEDSYYIGVMLDPNCGDVMT